MNRSCYTMYNNTFITVTYIFYICYVRWKDIRNKYRIILYKDFLEVDYQSGDDVFLGGDIVAKYFEEGYSVTSCYYGRFDGFIPDKIIKRIAFCLVALNPDTDLNILAMFMVAYCNDKSGLKDGVTYKYETMLSLLDGVTEKVNINLIQSPRKFYWNTRGQRLSLDNKRKAMLMFTNDRKSSDTLKKVDNAIQCLMTEAKYFITAKRIADVSGCGKETAKRYMAVYKDEVDRYNEDMFTTNSFATYRRILSIHKIKEAIHTLNKAEDSLSRRKVAKEAGVHFNTVQNLWSDEEIQEELNKYNQSI